MANWFTNSPSWTGEYRTLLLSEKNTDPVPPLKLEQILEKSAKFPRKFPITTVLCSQLKKKLSAAILEKNINSVYPVIHEHALHLYASFLLYQQQYGNAEFYRGMTLLQLVDRLLSKRAVSFVGAVDRWTLLDGSHGEGGWENVGTSKEQPPLTLRHCLSYDEIKLSALLSVSSYTYFINDGNRNNQGLPEQNFDESEETGVIVGMIGPRLEKENVMEYREIVKNKNQNTMEQGYGKHEHKEDTSPTLQQIFLEFYGDHNATYNELLPQLKSNEHRFLNLGDGVYFDRVIYQRRLALSVDTLLIEANERAKKQNTKAFIHVVGFGLGVWKITPEQDKLFTDTFAKRLEAIGDSLTHVGDVLFAFIGEKNIGGCLDDGKIKGIAIHIRDRDPHIIMKGVNRHKLLVVSYAWDGNALPGNEFWYGSLTGSSDPAAACSTQIAELHNYHINEKVKGANLMVATLDHGLVTFREYQEMHKND